MLGVFLATTVAEMACACAWRRGSRVSNRNCRNQQSTVHKCEAYLTPATLAFVLFSASAPASASCEALREVTQVAEHYASAHFRGDLSRDHYVGVLDLYIAVAPILERECSASKPTPQPSITAIPTVTRESLCVETMRGVTICRWSSK